MAHNVNVARALNQQTESLVRAIFAVTENVTDAAKTVSDFREDINSLPTKVASQFFKASIGKLPLGAFSVVMFSLFSSLCFAFLDTWGPFRSRSSTVASLGLGTGKRVMDFDCE